MVTVETIGRIRRAFWVDRKPIRQIVRELRISRKTVRKAIRGASTEFRYDRQVQPQPRLGGFVARLDSLLEANSKRPARERLTAQRLFELLRAEGYQCEFAGNRDPLRRCVSVPSFSAGAGWEGLGDDCGGHDRRDTACLFRAAPADQGDRTGAVGVARNGAQGGPRSGDGVQVRARRAADAEARRVDRSPDGDPGGGSEAASA